MLRRTLIAGLLWRSLISGLLRKRLVARLLGWNLIARLMSVLITRLLRRSLITRAIILWKTNWSWVLVLRGGLVAWSPVLLHRGSNIKLRGWNVTVLGRLSTILLVHRISRILRRRRSRLWWISLDRRRGPRILLERHWWLRK